MIDKDAEDNTSVASVGCTGCLAMIITWPYYWFMMWWHKGNWG